MDSLSRDTTAPVTPERHRNRDFLGEDVLRSARRAYRIQRGRWARLYTVHSILCSLSTN